jgi:hypothetical protein
MERMAALHSVVNGIGDSEVPGDGRGVDKERCDKAIQMAN